MLGMKFLGGIVSRDEDFIKGLYMNRAFKAAELISSITTKRSSELFLLRSCMSIAKLYFWPMNVSI